MKFLYSYIRTLKAKNYFYIAIYISVLLGFGYFFYQTKMWNGGYLTKSFWSTNLDILKDSFILVAKFIAVFIGAYTVVRVVRPFEVSTITPKIVDVKTDGNLKKEDDGNLKKEDDGKKFGELKERPIVVIVEAGEKFGEWLFILTWINVLILTGIILLQR